MNALVSTVTSGSQLVGDYDIVVPARNASSSLQPCLAALQAANPPPKQIVVFDDGSTDNTAVIAEQMGVEVIRHKGDPVGPACARNAGARVTTASTIVFIDSDVIVDPDAPKRLIDQLTNETKIAAAFGSYSAHQATSNVAARYANLRHHHFHQAGSREAETFWTGIGAVRRSTFQELGGFEQMIRKPQMEDIEFGFRLRAHDYRIRLVPSAQGAHLKDWTLGQLWRDDILTRALPWSKFLIDGKGRASLNANDDERLSAVLAHLIWLSALGALFNVVFAVTALAAAAVYIWMNRRILTLFNREEGPLFALAGLALHWLYHLYASATYAVVLATKPLRWRGRTHLAHWLRKQRGKA